ncbi:MAG: adenylyltransferase/cytidyltransferase family protein [Patescibacteria group bacterium]|nr:adenylyltransferase/cytidyltransferase family protein [Patescibacteria group bacterium]MBU1663052.1 adenylyltransferase/cytidyltransferase family protein [Patescibacteria group bacterium]MBU1933837.1 adenylyltransferase/cytidyltransferase family protein [Patescibacteria group bacterium]MBU2008061.1 adenylyltransferase/cytidyltransferase family protein [Patescibacteria group bacterium]MBU2233862.1 adenylyltransferase/cytidyltransferase family protein [Patescibacteria group bacterium]
MKKKKITIAVSGYFNPLHVGHLEMMEKAKKLGDSLVVIVNNDYQTKLKRSVPFLNQVDRMKIVSAIKWVDKVFLSIDRDLSVCKSLVKIKPDIFAKGGDRNAGNIPETAVCRRYGIKIVDKAMGKKIRSSSILIAEAAEKRFAREK